LHTTRATNIIEVNIRISQLAPEFRNKTDDSPHYRLKFCGKTMNPHILHCTRALTYHFLGSGYV